MTSERTGRIGRSALLVAACAMALAAGSSAWGYDYLVRDANNNPIGWTDRNTSTPATVDIFYDFRSETTNGVVYQNQITTAEQQIAQQALLDISAITGGKIVFSQSTTAGRNNIINIGVGNLAAAQGTTDTTTLGLGGAQANQLTSTLYDGIAWMSNAFTWDTTIGNGNPSSSSTAADFYSVAIHEIMHAIGLGHSESYRGNIMTAVDYGEKLSPAQDDINGIDALYGSTITPSAAYTAVTRTISGDMYVSPLGFYNYFAGNPSSLYYYTDAGTTTVTGTTYVRASNSYTNPAFFQQDGGVWHHTNVQIGAASRNGTMTLNNGTMQAITVTVNTNGTFIHNGGTLTIGTLNVTTGRPFTQSGGSATVDALINNGIVTQNAGAAQWGQVTGSGTLTVGGTSHARSVRQNTVSVAAGGALLLDPALGPPTVSEATTLTVNGRLDLAGNALVVDTTAANANSTYGSLLGRLVVGRDGGRWDAATGITSVTADADYLAAGVETHAVALVKNSDLPAPLTTLGGVSVATTALVLTYALLGDLDLDGQITPNDYLRMDQGLLYRNTGWAFGDVNYDGTVNYLDFAAVDQAVQAAGNTPLATQMEALHAAWFGAPYLAAIPEPGSLGLLSSGALGLLRITVRRRWRRL